MGDSCTCLHIKECKLQPRDLLQSNDLTLDQPRGNVSLKRRIFPAGTPMSVPTENKSGCDHLF